MKNVVFLDRGTMGDDLSLTPPAFHHQWAEYRQTTESEVVERLQGVQIAITNKVPIRASMLDDLPDLEMISIAATGYDVIDISACLARGIQVSNVRGYAIHTVPEHTFALILGLRRSISAYQQAIDNGEWQKAGQFCFFNFPINDLAGSRLGIIGEGAIGQAVAQLARAFGMQVMFAAHKNVSGLGPLYTPWDEVLDTADVISLHAPLSEGTRHCLAAPEFARMTRKPLIINTARGGLVDEQALVDALDAGQISGIGFDVLGQEPPAEDNALLKVIDRPNVILTPHIAWASIEARIEVWRQTIAHVNAFVQGEAINAIIA